MNVAAHQEEKNKNMGKRKKQVTDFKEAACYASAVVQRAAQQKNGLYGGSALGNWDPQESQQSF